MHISSKNVWQDVPLNVKCYLILFITSDGRGFHKRGIVCLLHLPLSSVSPIISICTILCQPGTLQILFDYNSHWPQPECHWRIPGWCLLSPQTNIRAKSYLYQKGNRRVMLESPETAGLTVVAIAMVWGVLRSGLGSGQLLIIQDFRRGHHQPHYHQKVGCIQPAPVFLAWVTGVNHFNIFKMLLELPAQCFPRAMLHWRPRGIVKVPRLKCQGPIVGQPPFFAAAVLTCHKGKMLLSRSSDQECGDVSRPSPTWC